MQVRADEVGNGAACARIPAYTPVQSCGSGKLLQADDADANRTAFPFRELLASLFRRFPRFKGF